MRALAVSLLLLGLGGAPALADEVASALPDADRTAIRSTIEGQMGAFKGDEADAAFAFASPHIQAMFGSAGNFLDMVRRGYAPVYRPRGVAFGPLVEIDGAPVQKVGVVGPDGAHDLALYYMERESDGTWRIDGCVLTHDDSVGA